EPHAYEAYPARTCLYFNHFADVPGPILDVVVRKDRYLLSFPSDDGLTAVAVGWPRAEFPRVRADAERAYWDAIDQAPAFAARVRAGTPVEPLRGTAETPMYLRTPYGPGWALLGDAGCRVDPITGEG